MSDVVKRQNLIVNFLAVYFSLNGILLFFGGISFPTSFITSVLFLLFLAFYFTGFAASYFLLKRKRIGIILGIIAVAPILVSGSLLGFYYETASVFNIHVTLFPPLGFNFSLFGSSFNFGSGAESFRLTIDIVALMIFALLMELKTDSVSEEETKDLWES